MRQTVTQTHGYRPDLHNEVNTYARLYTMVYVHVRRYFGICQVKRICGFSVAMGTHTYMGAYTEATLREQDISV